MSSNPTWLIGGLFLFGLVVGLLCPFEMMGSRAQGFQSWIRQTKSTAPDQSQVTTAGGTRAKQNGTAPDQSQVATAGGTRAKQNGTAPDQSQVATVGGTRAKQYSGKTERGPNGTRVTLNFIISDHGGEGGDCGGCLVLFNLGQILRRMGYNVARSKSCKGGEASATHITVLVLPEVSSGNMCKIRPNATIRWILAPLGINARPSISESWHPEDLVFNYGLLQNGAAMPVPYTNMLLAQNNPKDGDGFDVKAYAPKQRNGSIFIMRKANKFHKQIKIMHGPEAKPVNGGTLKQYLQLYLSSKYCYCYDPYSFHLQIAAMMGCISIQAPLGNLTKAEWLMTTLYAGYLADNNLSNMMGIAYGNSKSELEYAERTMSGTREELIRVREWGENVTVPRMIRDVERYIVSGARSGFEGALLVQDMYPLGWWKRNQSR